MKNDTELKVCVLFRFSKKTGKVDQTMTGLGSAMMEFWALQNTPKTKACMIVERDTGRVLYLTQGTSDGFPKVKSVERDGEIGNAEDYGIPLDVLRNDFKDDRFD